MESSTKSPFLDQFGKPLPDRIQQILEALTPRLHRKFSMIRDEVVLIEILERAGQQVVKYESEHGTVERLPGFAWVTVRNVAISRVRREPHLLEKPMAGSRETVTALARLTAKEGSPESIEAWILLREAMKQISERERKIAIWKKSGFSSRLIAKKLDMSVSAVDTTYARLREKLRKLLAPNTKAG
jgi:RNA polymerase sigma factor (sigma-70 family)